MLSSLRALRTYEEVDDFMYGALGTDVKREWTNAWNMMVNSLKDRLLGLLHSEN
jgi:hypothetical protein